MRYLPHTLILAAALTLAGCAHKPGLGSYADAGTTFLALNSGQFVEVNPLLSLGPSPAATALASIGIKHGAKHALSASGLTDLPTAHRAVEAGGMFGAGWNIASIIGVGGVAPIVGGFGAALWYWVWSGP